ncbi:MAG: helix-turn-helix domain-containing protein [Puniceicoccales bacterium]|jgi:cytoskeletal protein RodZ|nr:helix-turn-helix domain-containing protein [Puniceicoccales bacterium]
MAENFGEQFTAAREALGLTTSEVASKTKIRKEYLEAIEKGDFNFQLPDVYIRGFVRNYAKLLGLDVETVMRECPIKEVRVADSIKYHASALVESVKSEEEKACDVKDQLAATKKERLQDTLHNLSEKFPGFSKKNLTIALLIGVIFLLLLVIIFTARKKKEPFDFRSITPAESEKIPNKSITLSTTGTVKVVVRSKNTLEKIYAGNLLAGIAKTISYYRPIQVFYDRGECLLIQQDNGEKIYPQPGRGAIEIK